MYLLRLSDPSISDLSRPVPKYDKIQDLSKNSTWLHLSRRLNSGRQTVGRTRLSDSCRTGSSRADSLWPSRVTQSPYRRPSSSPRFLKRTNSFRVESSRSKNKTRSIRRPDCLLSTAYQRPTSNCCAFHQDATCRIIARLIKPHKIHSNYLLPAGCISRQPINNHCARFPSSFGTTEVFIYTPRVPFKLTPHKLLSKHFSFVGQHHFYMYMYMQAK